MTQAQFDVRNERAENGTFVISKSDGGFRVYSVHNPSNIYLVVMEGDRWTCTCPDFESHKADTTWRCKHVLAVAPYKANGEAFGPTKELVVVPPATPSNGNKPPRRPKAQHDHPLPPVHVQMIMKRSVSPDGRIDSISVEFSLPVSSYSNGEIRQRALSTLELQKEIVGAFLALNGSKASPVFNQSPQPPKPVTSDGKPVFARLMDIGKVNGRWGERLCINLQVNGRTLRLFGSAKQLAEHIQSTGYDIGPENLEPGLRLNLACRVTTKPSEDGKYLNVEKVLPLKGNTRQGGLNDGNIPY
jgi:SWIM zinc finger